MHPRLAANLALVAVMAVLLVSTRLQPTWARSTTAFDDIDLFIGIRYDLLNEYVTDPDNQELVEGAVRGMIESLRDPYTVYLSPEEFADFNKSVSGSFFGIGAEVRINPERDRIEIVTPLEDSPAWNAGVLAGDLILEIDGEDTEGMKLTDAVDRLTGDKGTDVTIRVRHDDGEEEEITITRDRIEVATVRGFTRDADQKFQYWIDPNAKIGYVRLTQFNQNSVEELRGVLEGLVADGAEALIFDLRFNPGGLLEAAQTVSDMFLEPGRDVVSVRGRAVPERKYTATSEPIVPLDIPVVVMANEASASAAEIVTGALKENDRAFVVGTRTFGKGSVQQLKQLGVGPNSGALKITNAYYYLPSGRNIHRLPILDEDDDVEKSWGVDPSDNAYVPMSTDQFRAMREARQELDNVALREATEQADVTPDYIRDTLSDPQLAAALEAVIGRMETGEFPAVGQDGSEAILAKQEREALEKAVERLEEQLDTVRAELAKLEPPTIEAGELEILPPEVLEDGLPEAGAVPDAEAEAQAEVAPMTDSREPIMIPAEVEVEAEAAE